MATTCFDHPTDAIASAYDFSVFSTLVAVGGDQGALLAAILVANPGLRGVLFDRPHVVADAGALMEAAGVADRCEIVGGDLFKSLPSGALAYLLKDVIREWDDEQALAIVTNCRRAMGQRGTLLLVERLRPADDPCQPRRAGTTAPRPSTARCWRRSGSPWHGPSRSARATASSRGWR